MTQTKILKKNSILLGISRINHTHTINDQWYQRLLKNNNQKPTFNHINIKITFIIKTFTMTLLARIFSFLDHLTAFVCYFVVVFLVLPKFGTKHFQNIGFDRKVQLPFDQH